ncbi:MAG: hypothetical protein GY954_09735 [Alteromonas sp.]|nr:hypothetical protein [Alteromonas sp.]
MKIFTGSESSWEEKVNFVDENDVFVGYDIGQDCCEHADYFIADTITPYSYNDEGQKVLPDVEAYSFDRDFFQTIESPDLDAGGMVAFRLVASGKPDLFLHLFNAHNGYYGHGFEVKHGGETVRNDYL